VSKKFLNKFKRNELLSEHKLEKNKRFADRIKTILLLDKGYSFAQISEILFIDEKTARNYKKSYLDGGLEQLIEDGYSGKATKLSCIQEQQLSTHLEEKIYITIKEIISYVRKTFKIIYSQSGMRDLLHRLNFSYKKPKRVPGKADFEKQFAFMVYLESLKAAMGKSDKLFYLDAVHPQHNSMPSYGWIKKGELKDLKTNSGRKRLNLHGAIELENFECIVRSDETINYESTLSLLKSIERKCRDSKKIYVICDNARYYWAKEVREYLEGSKIEMIHLPSYSANLNLIERLWKFFNKKILYNRYFERFEEFKEASLNFFKDMKRYKTELETLLSEKVEFVGV